MFFKHSFTLISCEIYITQFGKYSVYFNCKTNPSVYIGNFNSYLGL